MVSTIPLTFAAETKFTTLAIYSPKSYFNSMKKFFISLCLVMAGINSFAADSLSIGNRIPLHYVVPYIDPQESYPRTPIHAPSASIDGNTLYLWDECDFTLYIKEENGEIAYSTFVPATQTAVVLPANLAGTYTIEVTRGDITFIGEIEL